MVQPVQMHNESYDNYILRVLFYFDHCAWLENGVKNLNDTLVQDKFISNIFNSRILYNHVQQERTLDNVAQK